MGRCDELLLHPGQLDTELRELIAIVSNANSFVSVYLSPRYSLTNDFH